jgi:hypothetical protein
MGVQLNNTGTGVVTLASPASGTVSLTLPSADGSSGQVLQTNGSGGLSFVTSNVNTEVVYAITDAAAFEINPSNGGIQTITLGANRTPKATSFTAGQSLTLMVTAGAFTLTWTDTTFGTSGVKWVGSGGPGAAPTLSTTAITIIELWKVGSQVYGALVGVA